MGRRGLPPAVAGGHAAPRGPAPADHRPTEVDGDQAGEPLPAQAFGDEWRGGADTARLQGEPVRCLRAGLSVCPEHLDRAGEGYPRKPPKAAVTGCSR